MITKEELKTVQTVEIINIITNTDDSIVDEIIEESVDVMKSYLHKYFDTEAIFSATGEDRIKVVVKRLKDIVIYEIMTRRAKQANEVTQKKYDDAILWLEQIAAGKIEPDLPPKFEDTDGDGTPDTAANFLKLGSRPSYKNHW